jgi:hypothetical protein
MFVTDSGIRKIVEKNVSDSGKLDMEVKRIEYTQPLNEQLLENKISLNAEQDKIRDGFLDLLRVKVNDLYNSVVNVNSETEYKLSSIIKRIDNLDKNKQSSSDFDSKINSIHKEIETIKSSNTTQSAAFDLAMNRALDAEEIQQYQVIKDIKQAYALKSDQVQIESKINNLMNMKSGIDSSVNQKTSEILEQIQSLKDIDKIIKEFETSNMKDSNGDLVNKDFIQELERLHSDALEKIKTLDTKVDTLSLCETQNNLLERIQTAEKSVLEAKSACDSSKLVCEVAQGSDTIFMKPGGNIMLGDTGRYLTMSEGNLEVCEKGGICKTIVAA